LILNNQSTFRRRPAAFAVTIAMTLLMAACGGGTSDTSAPGGQPEDTQAQGGQGAPEAAFLTLTGESTSVDLDPGTAQVLADNNVTVEPVAPATASTSGDTTTVSFPISEGYVAIYPQSESPFIRGTFSHTGGLKFTAGGKSLEVTEFIVNPGNSELTATVNGESAAPILDLDGTNVRVSQGEGGEVRLDGTIAKLSQTGAEALNSFFGVSIFEQGIPLGEVHVVATGEPGPKGAPEAELLTLTGESTSVDLDPGTAQVLADNNVTVEPVAPATASTSGDTTTVSFPISEGYVAIYPQSESPFIRGTFSHTGGLKFTAGGKSLEVTEFIVNPGNSELTATVNGESAAPILDLDGTNVRVSQGEGGEVRLDGTIAKLSQTGAEALNSFFGVSIFEQGIPLGEVHVVATGEAAPQS
jgi:hypothetical protein